MLKKLKNILGAVGAWLGALGGQGDKELRRYVLSLVLVVVGYFHIGWWALVLGAFSIWASIGYGVPSPTDGGSTLGKFWYKVTEGNHRLTDILTRGTVGLGMCLTGAIVPAITQEWIFYFIGCILIMVGQTVLSYRDFGTMEIFGDKVLKSDVYNYGLIFTGYSIMLLTRPVLDAIL